MQWAKPSGLFPLKVLKLVFKVVGPEEASGGRALLKGALNVSVVS